MYIDLRRRIDGRGMVEVEEEVKVRGGGREAESGRTKRYQHAICNRAQDWSTVRRSGITNQNTDNTKQCNATQCNAIQYNVHYFGTDPYLIYVQYSM